MRKEKESIKEGVKEGVKKEIRLNINYLDFIKNLSNEKIEISNNNKEKIIKFYENSLNLRFNNLERVNNRVMRKELKEVRENYLKEINLSNEKFINISKKLLEMSKNRKSNNFISIKV